MPLGLGIVYERCKHPKDEATEQAVPTFFEHSDDPANGLGHVKPL